MLAIAAQVAGKATRDALFLSSFPVTDLPTMVIISSVISVLVVVATSRLFGLFGPSTVTPIAFYVSAGLSLLEWSYIDEQPRAVAAAAYIHFAVFGIILISGLWSVVNERFDPRTAKPKIARITIGATAGGVIGGLLAERVAALSTVATMLPIFAALQVLGGILVWSIGGDSLTPSQAKPSESENGFKVLARDAYLREIALLLLVVTVAAGFLDYVFKDVASQSFGDGESLMQFFAAFYTILGLATFAIQSVLANPVLQRFGIARTVSSLPLMMVTGVGVMMIVPGLAAATFARAAEAVFRNSLFRTGYELLYTPVAERDKRSAKTIIDAGFDRLGDAAAGLIISGLIFIAPTEASGALVLLAGVAAGIAVFLSMLLHRGYVDSLEKRLLERAADLDLNPGDDVLRTGAVMQTMATVDLGRLVTSRSGVAGAREELRALRQSARRIEDQSAITEPELQDGSVRRLVGLRSGDLARVSKALTDPGPFELVHVPQLIQLLAWDEVSGLVTRALRELMPRCAGALLDALLDGEQEFTIRRRVPRVLSVSSEQWVAAGLLAGLHDKRFEVRYQCGRALARIHHRHPEIEFDRDAVCTAVVREVAVDERVWKSYRLLDSMDEDEEGEEETLGTEWLNEYLADRTGRGLEHVFTLLALVLPSAPLRIAFRGIHTDDQNLRGTALEYLESVLPERVREPLWPFIDQDHRRPSTDGLKDRDEVLAALLKSNSAIEASIAGMPRPEPKP